MPKGPTQVYVRHSVDKFLGGLPSLWAEPVTSQRCVSYHKHLSEIDICVLPVLAWDVLGKCWDRATDSAPWEAGRTDATNITYDKYHI